jgi:hypothetical protein
MVCSSEKLAVKAEAPPNGAGMSTLTAAEAAAAEATINAAFASYEQRYPDDETYVHPSVTNDAHKAIRLAAMLNAAVARGTPHPARVQ